MNILHFFTAILIMIILAVVIGIPLDFMFKLFTGEKLSESKKHKGVFDFLGWTILIVSILITAILAPGFEGKPTLVDNLFKPKIMDHKLDELDAEEKRINNTLSDIENLTISELKLELKSNLEFVKSLRKEAIEQNKLLNNLKDQTKKEIEKSNDLKEQAEIVNKLSNEQLQAVNLLLTKDAKSTATRNLVISSVLSFLLGIGSSYIASILYTRRRRMKKVDNK